MVGAIGSFALFAYQVGLQSNISQLNADTIRVSSALKYNQDLRNSLSAERLLLVAYIRKGQAEDLDAYRRQILVSDTAWTSLVAVSKDREEVALARTVSAGRDGWNRWASSALALPVPREISPVADAANGAMAGFTTPDNAYIAHLNQDMAADVSAIGMDAKMGLTSTMASTGLLLVALIGVAALFMARLARPMGILSSIAAAMASDPETVVPMTDRNDEVGDLARGLAGWKQAELARRAADRENVTRSRFMSNMSHELRTPLNAIIGFSELLLDDEPAGTFDRETRKQFLTTINASGEHLLSLVNDLLDLAKVGAERMEAKAEPVNVSQTIEATLSSLLPLALAKRITLIGEPEADLIAQADPRMVRQILLNLISNALKFTPDGGSISVGARTAEENVEVWVRDTGPGIAEGDQERIFGEFEQIKSPDGLDQQGTGLGLALSLALAKRMGGSLNVRSELGSGTTFTLTLPCALAVVAT